MNLDIVVKPVRDGRFSVSCTNFPNCESEASSVEEALDHVVDKIMEFVSGNIRSNLKAQVGKLSQMISQKQPINSPVLMTNLPISLN